MKSGSGNLVTACHGLLLFVLRNSSSNQSSNFALRILVGEMSPRDQFQEGHRRAHTLSVSHSHSRIETSKCKGHFLACLLSFSSAIIVSHFLRPIALMITWTVTGAPPPRSPQATTTTSTPSNDLDHDNDHAPGWHHGHLHDLRGRRQPVRAFATSRLASHSCQSAPTVLRAP